MCFGKGYRGLFYTNEEKRTFNSLESKFYDFADLNADQQAIIHYMYNSGEKMTTAKAVELTGRSRRHIGKVLKSLSETGFLKWYGNSKNDKNQYYMLALKSVKRSRTIQNIFRGVCSISSSSDID